MKNINGRIIKLVVLILVGLSSGFTYLASPSVLTNETKASNGDTQKQLELGVYYLQSKYSSHYRCLPNKFSSVICKGIESLIYKNEIQDTTSRGIYWLKKAVNSGDIQAKYHLAIALQKNDKTDESRKLLEQLVEIGHIDANYQLGWYYLRGIGVDIDYNRAINFLTYAKDNNHPKAERLLEVAISESKS